MKINLEEFKKKVEESLVKNNDCTIEEAKRLMTKYEDDFQECFKENWRPTAMSIAMAMNYL